MEGEIEQLKLLVGDLFSKVERESFERLSQKHELTREIGRNVAADEALVDFIGSTHIPVEKLEDGVQTLSLHASDAIHPVAAEARGWPSLEERISVLEDERDSRPKGPEAILTCVQCNAEYKESENADGHCKYHTGTFSYGYQTRISCCGKSARSSDDLMKIPGCTKGKHQSKHHTKFFYSNYLFFMNSLCNEAKETWLEMDLYDYVAESCLWAEVGLSSHGEVFVVAGPKYSPEVCVSLKLQELKKRKKSPEILFEKSDSVGWSLKAELMSSNSLAESIIVTLKPAWSKVSFTKKVNFMIKDDSISAKSIECLSDPKPEKPSVEYTVPEENKEGPVLDPGEDYSQGRKNDYPTETSDDMFAVEIKQLGHTEVDSVTWGMRDGKWRNIFTTNIKVINNSAEIISIADVLGEYQNAEGDWVNFDAVYVKLRDSKDFLETKDFLIDSSAPTFLFLQLDIRIQDDVVVPGDNQERMRAYYKLPQPFLFKITLVDTQQRTASVMLEQGNKPLPLATLEKRQASWSKKRPLLFHMFADDLNLRKRSDVAIYYDDDFKICYRPAPNDNCSNYFYLNFNDLEALAYKAKKTSQKEVEIKGYRKENKESVVEVFAVVDLEWQYCFALKVVIKTPTSSATGYFLLPKRDFSKASISVSPTEVEIKSDLTIEWNLPQVSKNDRIEVYNKFGSKSVARVHQKESETLAVIKAPGSPGEYEVRYNPSCLRSIGLRHSVYVAAASFTVITA